MEHPGLKSETWATHFKIGYCRENILPFYGWAEAGEFFGVAR
jgi:hypothetical protein